MTLAFEKTFDSAAEEYDKIRHECQRRQFSEKFTRICYHWNREPLLGINRQP